METNEKGARKTGRSRYWSVMLVGEHGRVIPFHHFKTLIVGVGVVLILSLCALILLGVLYTRQRGQISHLQKNLEELRIQSTKLRDEKDLYLTQLIALKKQAGVLPQKATDAPQVRAEGGPPPADAKAPPVTEKATPKPEPEKAQKEIPAREAEPQAKWSADIRNFKVSYDNRQGALTAEFRIYNTSRPKKRLRGRTVVVFKAIGDPPSQWAIVPAVPLHNETPVGKQGRPFQIRNYQTERFKTLRRMNSPKYDIAAVYLFTDQDGELIGNKELPFNVDYSPPAPPKPKPVVAPPKPKPVVAPPEPEPEKPIAPRQTPPEESATPEQSAPGDSTAPDSAPNSEEPPSTKKSPDSPSGPSSPETPTSQEQPKVQVDAEGSGTSTPEASEAIPPTPAAEPKPPQEGEAH